MLQEWFVCLILHEERKTRFSVEYSFNSLSNYRLNSTYWISAVSLCLDVQRRAESHHHMPGVQREERFKELLLDSASCGGRFASSDLQCGTMLSFNIKRNLFFNACWVNEYSIFVGERVKVILQGRKGQRGQQDVL